MKSLPARFAYIASYPGPDVEHVLFRDSYWSPRLSAQWDRLVRAVRPGLKLQAWYSDRHQVTCLSETYPQTKQTPY